ncbi:MAG: amidophosphoribosyltransferase [Acidobacteria bacterium]|nr:amidophosphoribosyltransferase [Acidobacteriota bacterium]
MFDKFHEECGVFAIYGHPEAANMANLGIFALQHRGQESAGIASADGAEVYCHKAMGHVADIFTVEVLNGLPGDKAIGHTRYSTTGDSAKLNAQPFSAMTNKGRLALAHNGNITNAMEIRNALESEGAIFSATSDTEVVLHLISRSRERTLPAALRDALLQLEGAFSLVLLTKNELIVVRDPHGFRPMAMGQMEMSGDRISYVFASETCAFDLMGAVYMGDVEPGEMVVVNKDGLTRERYAPRRPLAQCVFEHVYFSRPDSMVFGRPVVQSREAMGRLLARQNPIEADVVVPVPDSGVAAAIGFSSESGIPFRMGLIRNHHVGRTFIEPSQAIRDFGVKLKLNPVRHLLRGKRVVLVDDSIVRGTTSRKIVRMVRNAGATEVHLRISCPPTISPCFYGVDTPTKNELIAANHSVQEICRYVEADSLEYLALPNLRDAVADTRGEYCYSCYTGEYPTELVSVESLIGTKTPRG